MNNSQKGFVVPLLIGIIALLVVGGGVYIYQNEKIEVPEVVDTAQQTNQIQQQTNTQTSPVSTQRINVPSQTDSSFRIISPKVGDEWMIGGTYFITFQNLPKGSFVQGSLQNMNEANIGRASVGVVDTGRDGNPSSNIQIKVPSQWCGGECGEIQYVTPGQYRLQLRIYPSVQNPSHQTFYSDYFNIIAPNTAQPSITILSPNGGEMWQEGIVYPIRWSAKNISGNQTIKLVNSNNTVIRTIDPNVKTVNGGTGLYQLSWSIPQAFVSEASPGKFKILISSADNTISDYSDNQFTIYASGRGY